MNTNIKATNMELTSSITDYVNKKIESLAKFLNGKDAVIKVEVGKTTQHHKNGEYYRAEIDISAGDVKVYASSEENDLYSAIDSVKEEIARSLVSMKDRKKTLFKRGATSVKKMIKGLSKRNPFTSKYE